MVQALIGQRVTIVVSSRGELMLEYTGNLIAENEDAIVLANVDITCFMLKFQRGMFGDGISKYKNSLDKVVINKKYIISCDTLN